MKKNVIYLDNFRKYNAPIVEVKTETVPVIEVVKEVKKFNYNIFFTIVFSILFIAMVMETIYEVNLTSQKKENLVSAFKSDNMEQELKNIDKNLIINRNKDVISYQVRLEVPRLHNLMAPNIYLFEIQKDKASKTLIWKDILLENVAYKIDGFKELLKGSNITEVKTVPDLKTGRSGISLRVEDNQ